SSQMKKNLAQMKNQMKLSKIYTRTGDKGSTALIGGQRVSKSHFRLECYGTLDELNAFTGKLKALCAENKEITTELENIQSLLFNAGTALATPPGAEWANMPCITEEHIKELETLIDKMNGSLEPLKAFAIPGSDLINAEAHICRTVCRRAERILCNAKENGIAVSDSVLAYINRLSDYFFVLSRCALHLQGKTTA
ncbi:MAG: cob(I)yrinic acid a,c-diamide adenosyltransferase, partial [Fibromonadales bacterium]|nr:cob(I)yrinic acid a,c-diamide adenosyltransferase [Fibromonadales bacterium]